MIFLLLSHVYFGLQLTVLRVQILELFMKTKSSQNEAIYFLISLHQKVTKSYKPSLKFFVAIAFFNKMIYICEKLRVYVNIKKK